MSFASTLKDLLNENAISQARLASAIGFSQRAVSKWINAQAEPTETAIISCAFPCLSGWGSWIRTNEVTESEANGKAQEMQENKG